MKISEIQHYQEFKTFVMKVDDDFAKIEYTEKDNYVEKEPTLWEHI